LPKAEAIRRAGAAAQRAEDPKGYAEELLLTPNSCDEKTVKTYLKLFGGLGNQLFQYAYGQHLKASGQKVRYVLRFSKNCLTDVFDLPSEEMLASSNSLVDAARKAYLKYIARNFLADFFPEQTYAWAVKGRLPFRREEAYKRNPWFERIAESNSVAIHVRGGDYLSATGYEGWGSVCGKEYYDEAVARIEASVRSPRYFLFTNDYEHSARVLPEGIRDRLCEVRDEESEKDAGFHLFLMGACSHNIIANSTYSWWGAFLGESRGRKVVAPARWQRFTTPPEWELI